MSHPQHPPYGAPPLPGAHHLPEVGHLVPYGEQPRGVVDADLCDLVRRPPRRYRKERFGRVAEAGLGCLSVVFYFGDYVADLLEDCTWGLIRSLRRLCRGRGLTRGWESRAGRFARAVRGADNDHDNDDVLLLFTDRRILLAGSGSNTPGRTAADRRAVRVLGELPYPDLVRVEPRHTWISSRVDLHFADGSRLALEVDGKELPALVALGPR
ncbi:MULTISPECIES: hypothetical protein [Kitasatospora]|uniref:Uncharacterized protein n=1 Tax=Kitasatospora setae (strain ATCC 33774 / DSM 43861 / JCM 3304 / KCC A-0304 / NBRC 14216 / KM-6054) TaxID=452652 RepID=E4NHR7_KITSK|nr:MULTISPECIES: hypothetical protein [Kitasatospora]BAJ31047.1 hypothetical protein KSE_52710 [Kitasatospora setae KM-6054]